MPRTGSGSDEQINKSWLNEWKDLRSPSIFFLFFFALIIKSPTNTLMTNFSCHIDMGNELSWVPEKQSLVACFAWSMYIITFISSSGSWGIPMEWDFQRLDQRVTMLLQFIYLFFWHSPNLYFPSVLTNLTPIVLLIPFWDYLCIPRNCKVNTI